MHITRRGALLGATALSACSSGATPTVSIASLTTGIKDAGAVVSAMATAYSDLKTDGLIQPSSATDQRIAADVEAALSADRALQALGANLAPAATATPLAAVVADFNSVAAAVNAILPAAAAVDPKLQPIVFAFQAATLILQTVIEPLIGQLAPALVTRVVAFPVRFAPPPDLTVGRARATLAAYARIPT